MLAEVSQAFGGGRVTERSSCNLHGGGGHVGIGIRDQENAEGILEGQNFVPTVVGDGFEGVDGVWCRGGSGGVCCLWSVDTGGGGGGGGG